MGKKNYSIQKSTSVRSFRGFQHEVIKKLWQWRPVALEEYAVDLIFRPKKYQGSHTFDYLLKEGHSYYLPVKTTGKYIHVTELGNGPCIILAHGWASEKSQMTSFIPKLLESGFSVLLYDQPAHGKSTSVSTNLFDFIRSLEAVIRYKKDVHGILAHSMACSAAIYNLHLFQWIKKGVLIAPHYDFEEELVTWFQKRGMTENMLQDFITCLENKYQLKLNDINPKNVAHYINHADIFMVHDLHDRYAPFRGSEKLHQLFPSSSVKKTELLGHAKILHNENVIKEIVDFFKS